MLRIALLSLVLPTLAAAGCGGAPTFSEVRSQVFQPSCNFSSCHNATSRAGGLDLQTSPHAALVGADPMLAEAKADGMKRVVAGDLAKSFLYVKLTLPSASDARYGFRMPQTNTPPEPSQVDLVKRWIEAGAPND